MPLPEREKTVQNCLSSQKTMCTKTNKRDETTSPITTLHKKTASTGQLTNNGSFAIGVIT